MAIPFLDDPIQHFGFFNMRMRQNGASRARRKRIREIPGRHGRQAIAVMRQIKALRNLLRCLDCQSPMDTMG